MLARGPLSHSAVATTTVDLLRSTGTLQVGPARPGRSARRRLARRGSEAGPVGALVAGHVTGPCRAGAGQERECVLNNLGQVGLCVPELLEASPSSSGSAVVRGRTVVDAATCAALVTPPPAEAALPEGRAAPP